MTEPTTAVDGEPDCTIFIPHPSDLDRWHAVWSNQDGFVADFDGASEEEAVAWHGALR
jgi:hypothetical protein